MAKELLQDFGYRQKERGPVVSHNQRHQWDSREYGQRPNEEDRPLQLRGDDQDPLRVPGLIYV
jgi:hypothetical protein